MQHYIRITKAGLVERISPTTGLVEHIHTVGGEAKSFTEIEHTHAPVVKVEKTLLEDIPDFEFTLLTRDIRVFLPCTKEVKEEIINSVAEGFTLKSVVERPLKPAMPPLKIIAYWLSEDQEFNASYKEALKIAAIARHDSVLDEADGVNPNNAKAVKVKVDALKWSAEMLDPDTYQAKAKDTPQLPPNIQIVFHTGVPEREAVDVTPKPKEIAGE
jgi:hypothetical protein